MLSQVYIFPPPVRNPRLEMTDALAAIKGIKKEDLPENRSDKNSAYEISVRDEIIVTARIIYKALSHALGDGANKVQVITRNTHFKRMDGRLKTLADQKTSFDRAMTNK